MNNTDCMINLGILTSSRADFGIYEPLLELLKKESQINTKLIVFGTHLSERFGRSIKQVYQSGIQVIAECETAPIEDNPSAITESMIKTMSFMNKVWTENKFDLVIALGDRYEMFAAVSSGLPFNIKFGHIHGGETTTGAIDNAFRHSISLMSDLHFTSNEAYRKKVIQLLGNEKGVFNTGALSIDNLCTLDFLSMDEINQQFGIDLNHPAILITLHPETIDYKNNEEFTRIFINSLLKFPELLQVITMPNADTSGLVIRKLLSEYANGRPNVKLVENFGSRGYLSVMKYSSLILGNSSSGFIEASWFPKWVVNVGNRQGGRYRTPNIIDVPFNDNQITSAISNCMKNKVPLVEPVYGDGKAGVRIINTILNELCIDK